jgi:hypothetical protein
MRRAVARPLSAQLSPSWYRDEQYQGALVSWNSLIPDGRSRMGVLVGARRVRSGDPRSIRTVLEVLEFGSGTIQTVETWQAFPVQDQ